MRCRILRTDWSCRLIIIHEKLKDTTYRELNALKKIEAHWSKHIHDPRLQMDCQIDCFWAGQWWGVEGNQLPWLCISQWGIRELPGSGGRVVQPTPCQNCPVKLLLTSIDIIEFEVNPMGVSGKPLVFGGVIPSSPWDNPPCVRMPLCTESGVKGWRQHIFIGIISHLLHRHKIALENTMFAGSMHIRALSGRTEQTLGSMENP